MSDHITMKRAAYILGHMYGLNGAVGAPAIFMGSPGGGKTTLLREYAARYLNNNMATIEVSRMQGTDINIPIPDHVNKRVDFYTNGELQDLAASKSGMLFFDELTRPSDQGALAAVLNVFLERRIGKCDLRHIHCWAAANPAEQVGGVELDPAFMNRLIVVNWPEGNDAEAYADHMNRVSAVTGATGGEDWPAAGFDWQSKWDAAWADANRTVIGFIRTQPNMLSETCPTVARPWRSKRSWALATNVLAACAIHNATPGETRALIGGTVGDEAAHALLTWRKAADLPDPWDTINGRVDVSKRRADELFVILGAACDTFIQTHVKDKADKRLEHKKFADFLMTCGKSHLEIVTAVVGRIPKAGIVTPAWVDVFTKCITLTGS